MSDVNAKETDENGSGESSCSTDGDTTRPQVREWLHSTTMDNGAQCVVSIDLVDGRCSCPEEARELVQWFQLIMRRFERQAGETASKMSEIDHD